MISKMNNFLKFSLPNEKSSRDMKEKYNKATKITIDRNEFPVKYIDEISRASTAISVNWEAIHHALINELCYAMAHSDAEIEGKDWIEPIMCWKIIVAPSGTKKSAGFKFARKIVNFACEKLRKEGFDVSTNNFQDGTIEKIGDIMAKHHGKISLLRDEISSVILMLAGAKNNKDSCDAAATPFLLERYDAECWVHQTMSGTNFSLPRTCVVLGGNMQPIKIMRQMFDVENVNTGILTRFSTHFIKPRFLNLNETGIISRSFIKTLVNDVFIPTWRSSLQRKNEPARYIFDERF